jgi:rubrerythrin
VDAEIQMSLLKTEPSGAVRSLEELFAIAYALEREAATRYAEIADHMRADGNSALADVFERLAAEEQAHLDTVIHWSERERGSAPDPARMRWKPPETFDDEGVGTTDSRLVTAYRALSMAVRNEERAFAFWSYVAAHAVSAEIRLAAESMAREKLNHVAALRRERRNAYHAGRLATPSMKTEDVGAETAALERRLADQLEVLATFAVAREREMLRELAEEARKVADEFLLRRVALPPIALSARIPDGSVALAELLVDRYLEAADRIRDEATLAWMQSLAGRAIDRLAWLRRDLPEIRRC